MAAHGIFRGPEPRNEPVRDHAPGTPEREQLRVKLADGTLWPIPVTLARQMSEDAILKVLVTEGVDVVTVAHGVSAGLPSSWTRNGPSGRNASGVLVGSARDGNGVGVGSVVALGVGSEPRPPVGEPSS